MSCDGYYFKNVDKIVCDMKNLSTGGADVDNVAQYKKQYQSASKNRQ